ncbi:MAG: butyrate kinase [Bdellovibrionales bacterium RIFOXYD1_FULL_53_11]|nr:MAG: butyrate kinase [Bdellovibrionales bacterium RIFOXYD1_FULL_53_11]
MSHKPDSVVLVVNPGSTSDEIALFRGNEKIFHKVVRYSPKELEPYDGKKVTSQYEFRKQLVLKTLEENGINQNSISAVVGRGGLVKPIPSGTYSVDQSLLADLTEGVLGDHPSNLGGIIAHAIASPTGKPSFIADPVVVDELEPLARYSGMPENPRISIFHALNQKRVARKAAAELGKRYEDCNFIVMHGGGGLTVGAHRGGRVIDVNNGLDGDGPFTPQRSGGVPSGGLVKMCFGGKLTAADIKLKIKGKGGMVAYTGTSDMVVIEKFIEGKPLEEKDRSQIKPGLTPEKAREALQAMAYQISKEIIMLAAPLKGKVDAIILTGGLAYSKDYLVPWIKEHVEWLAPVKSYPGGDEMSALRDAAERVLSGSEKAKNYPEEI